MAEVNDEELLRQFYAESNQKILAWATEKRMKGSSISKHERQKLNNKISA